MVGGAEAYFGLTAMAHLIGSFANSPTYYSDVNGDGIADLVNGGAVQFGYLDGAGDVLYSGNSNLTPVPIPAAGSADVSDMFGTYVDAEGNTASYDDLFEDRVDQFPLLDSVRRWVAPYDGVISIAGDVQLVDDPAADGYATNDGVRVAIQHNGGELWSQLIDEDEFSPFAPTGVSSLPVLRGDRVYFRVQSRFDGRFDEVQWDPVVEYQGVTLGTQDANGFDPYRFVASQEFTLAGRPTAVRVPMDGQLQLTGNLIKPTITTDDVRIVVRHNGAPLALPASALAWSDVGEIPLDHTLGVVAGDTLEFYIEVDSAIDMTLIDWSPCATYVGADPPQRIYAAADADLYPGNDLTAPQGSWTAPSTTTVTVDPDLVHLNPLLNSEFVVTVKTHGALLYKQAHTIQNGAIMPPLDPFALGVTEDDELFFDISTRDGADQDGPGLAASVIGTGFTVDGGSVPSGFHSSVRADIHNEMFRSWSYFAYNGNRDLALMPLDEVAIDSYDLASLENELADGDGDGVPDDVSGVSSVPVYPMAPVTFLFDPGTEQLVEVDDWKGPDEYSSIGPSHIMSSRMGLDFIWVPTEAAFAGARAVSRFSESFQFSAGLGAGVSGSGGIGVASGKTDFMDMNGDGFPDIIGGGRVQYTTMTGALEDQNAPVSGLPNPLRSTQLLAYSVGIGITSPTSSSQDSKGNAAPSGKQKTSSGDQGSTEPEFGISGDLAIGITEGAVDIIDMNGGGLPDRVRVELFPPFVPVTFLDPPVGPVRVALNTGYGFLPEEDWSVPGGTAAVNRARALNVGFGVGFNDGSYGFAGGVSATLGTSDSDRTLLDVNGDGLTDLVETTGTVLGPVFDGANDYRVYYNTGSGFLPSTKWHTDLGGDAAENVDVEEGAGAYFTIPIGPICLIGCYVIINPGIYVSHSMSRPTFALIDINGDRLMDQVASADDSSMDVALNRIGRSNLLKTVHRPLGARIDLGYERDGNTPDNPPSRWNLSRVEVYDGHPGDGVDTMLTTYAYEGGIFEPNEREFYGYSLVREEQRDTSNGEAVYRTVERQYLNGTFYDRGLLASERTSDGAGNTYKLLENTYRILDVDTQLDLLNPSSTIATAFPQLIRTDRSFFEGAAAPGMTTHFTFEYDQYGNVTEYFDAGNPGAADDLTSTIEYAYDVANHVLDRAARVVISSNGVELRRREADVEVGTGNLLQVRRYLAGGQAAIHDMTYFSDGGLKTITGPPNANGQRYMIEYDYDPVTGTHVSSILDSYGLQSTTTYDLRFGKPDVVTDANGNPMDYDYDAYGRLSSLTGPYEAGTGMASLTHEYHPDAAEPWALTRHLDPLRDIVDPIESVVFTDGLGRLLQVKEDKTVHSSPDAGSEDVMVVSGRLVFDHVGRIVEQRHPVTEPLGTPGAFNFSVDPVSPTVREYDVLDRIVRYVLPSGVTSLTAFGFGNDRDGLQQFQTDFTDGNGNTKLYFATVRDRVTSIREANDGGAELIWSSYERDPLGQTTAVVDDHGNRTSLAYDALGRITAIDSPDGGLIEWFYDLDDNLSSKVTATLRAEGQQITYDYDFRRRTSISYPQFPENDVAYTYGAAGADHNRAGRVVTTTYEGGAEERFYGKLGEVTREIHTIASHTQGNGPSSPEVYTTEYLYDTWNRLHQMVYPDDEVLTYTYDSGGQIAAASGVREGFAFSYVQRLEYNKFSRRAFLKAGNGVATAYEYLPGTQLLTNLKTGRDLDQPFQNLSYEYDALGNVLGIVNDVPVPEPSEYGGPVTQTFEYDDLYRLVEAEGEHVYAPNKRTTYTFRQAFDTIHNILEREQVHRVFPPNNGKIQKMTTYDFAYEYGGPQPHAVTHVDRKTYSYDVDGNQLGWDHDTTGQLRSIVWDEEARIQSIADNGNTKTYKYDDQSRRVVKRGPGGEIAFVNAYYTVRNRSIATKHVFVDETRLVSKVTPGRSAPHPDDGNPEANFQYFIHADHIGSSAFVTDEDGELYEHIQYFPGGETWVREHSNTHPMPYLFTGQEYDKETGLYYFGDRYYEPRVGSFLNPDQFSLDAEALAASGLRQVMGGSAPLNLYAYAANNPLRYNDPRGQEPSIAETLSADNFEVSVDDVIGFFQKSKKTQNALGADGASARVESTGVGRRRGTTAGDERRLSGSGVESAADDSAPSARQRAEQLGIGVKSGANGADVDGLSPAIVAAFDEIAETWAEYDVPAPVITSALDGRHREGSRHYTGNAIDLRGNNLSDDVQDRIAADLRGRLGANFDVVSEKFPRAPQLDHIHIEYDPKD